MERITPTRNLALRIWWAFVWRACAAAFITSFLLGILFGVLMMIVPLEDAALRGLEALSALIVAGAISVEVMYRLLKKRFGDFEIALIRTEE